MMPNNSMQRTALRAAAWSLAILLDSFSRLGQG